MFAVLTLIAWTLIGYFVPQFLILPPLRLIIGDAISQPFWEALYEIIFYIVSVILTVFISHKFIKKWKTSRTELGLKNLPTWSDIGLAFVGFVAYLVLAFLLVKLFSLFPFFDANEVQETNYGPYLFGLNKVFAMIALVIAAPVAEEVIFRGWLYGKLRAKIPGKLSLPISILIVSAIFGLLHDQLNVAVNVFAMSIVMCLMREFTGTIYSGILLHIIKNAVAFYLIFIMI